MRRILPLALLFAPTALVAQLPSTSIRSLGLAGTYETGARGYEASAWNPAVLAGRQATSFSIGLPQAQLEFGSNSYGLSDFTKYQGTTLSPQDKVDLLAKVDTTLDLRTVFGVAPFGLQIWRFGFSLGASGDMVAGLGKDAVDLALNGNAARAGPGQFFTAAGSHLNGWGAATAAFSFAWPFELPIGRLSVGATYKKIWGAGLARGGELSSQFQINPQFAVSAAGHAIYTNYAPGQCRVNSASDASNLFSAGCAPGSGSGLDVGGLLEMGRLTIGATLVNMAGSMTWDPNRLTYERSTYTVQQVNGVVTNALTRTTLTGIQIDGDATAKALKDSLLAHAGFSKFVRAGIALRAAGFRLSADGQLRLSQGVDDVPAQAVSAGAEYVLLGVLPLRAGIGTDFSKTVTFAAGTGLYLGPLHLDIGAANISGGTHPGVRIGLGLGLMFGGGGSNSNAHESVSAPPQ